MFTEISVNAYFSKDLKANSWFCFTHNPGIIMDAKDSRQHSGLSNADLLTSTDLQFHSTIYLITTPYHNLDFNSCNFSMSEIVNSDTPLISVKPLYIAGNKRWFKL